MNLATRTEIAGWLNRLPMVTWDRFTTGNYIESELGYVTAYGWIARDDGRFDFVLMEFQLDPEGKLVTDHDPAATTSSSEYSREIQRLLIGTDEGHVDCQRIDETFGGLVERVAVLS